MLVIGRATTALGAKRIAVRAGYEVFSVCPPNSWAARTRYHRALPASERGVWQGELGDEGLEFLRALPFERAVPIPTSDHTALWLAERPADLRSRFPDCCSSPDSLRALQDKFLFADLVKQHDVPCPSTFAVDSLEDVRALPVDGQLPLFFKPRDSQEFNRRFGIKALKFDGLDAALKVWQDFELDANPMLAQEYVPGGADRHYFIDGFMDSNGQVRALVARQRLRMYPADFGNSSMCMSVPVEDVEVAWQHLKRLLDATEYRGIFSAEFKCDERDDVFRILEVNTRPWVYIEFAEHCGVNMVDLYVRDALGETGDGRASGRTGRLCVDLLHDYHAVRSLPREQRPALPGLLLSWARASKRVFSWRDPAAAWHSIKAFIRRRAKRILAR